MITDEHPRAVAARGRTGRGRGREGAFAVLTGFLLAAVFNFPVVLHPKSTVAGEPGDPLLQAWQLAWQHHFLTSGGDLWTGNTLFPATGSYAFSDSLLGYLPLSLFGDGPYDALLRYNAAYLIACALAYAGAYVLVRQLGGTWPAAVLAGLAFAWAPWRLSHASHLNILSTGGIALALFALARGHGFSLRHGWRPELSRPWWAFAGWVIAAWQITLGFAIGLPFAYLLGVVGVLLVVTAVRQRRRFGTRTAVADGAGIAVFAVVTYLMTIPYRRVVDQYGFTRSWNEVRQFSPPPQGLLAAPTETWFWQHGPFNLKSGVFADPGWLSATGAPEKLLFPGLALLVAAVAGLFVSAWPVRVRAWLGAGVVAGTVFALGSQFFGGYATYYPLWHFLPGWDALRTPGRLMLWVILLLALLAAGAVTRWGELVRERQDAPYLRALIGVTLLLALLEGVPAEPHSSPAGIPPDLARTFAGSPPPTLILPVRQGLGEFSEYVYQLWSTDGFPSLVNGHNGLLPPQYAEIVRATKTFPDARSVAVLRKYGVGQVVLLKAAAAGGPYAQVLARPLDGLGLTRTDSTDLVTFTLR